ncbi:excalibur calcium-binding domain-containing protein, partial [Streptomyces sp. NPDC055078]
APTVTGTKPGPTVTETETVNASDSGSGSGGSDSGGSGSGGSSSVYYENCAAARAAGAAPVTRGDPGYGRHLDRDNDGTGCDGG